MAMANTGGQGWLMPPIYRSSSTATASSLRRPTRAGTSISSTGMRRREKFLAPTVRKRARNCIDGLSATGEHTFLDVINSSSLKQGQMRVIIELNFRAEFKMAWTCKEYGQRLQRLPEVFVGKVERLQGVIEVVCLAAKRCRKEKGMHMGPWRKHRYMQAKWTVLVPGRIVHLACPPSKQAKGFDVDNGSA